MEKVFLTFREKIGTVTMSLGVAFLFFALLILASWFFTPIVYRSQVNITKLLVILVFGGIGLIRISLYTVKK